MYRRLLGFLRPHSWRMALTIATNTGAAVLDAFTLALLIPFLNALFGQPAMTIGSKNLSQILLNTIGRYVDQTDKMHALQNIVVVILVAVLVKNVLVWFGGQLAGQLQELVTRDMRNAVYAHLQLLPLGYFTRTKTGQVISRVLTDTQQTKQLITVIVTQSLQNAAYVMAYVAALLFISPKLTLYALVVAPLLIGALQPLLRKLRKGHRRLANRYGEMTSVVQESVSGIRLVKSFGGEAYEEGRFVDASNSYAKGMVRVVQLANMAQPITEVVGTAMAVFILWLGAQQVLVAHTMSGAELIAFLTFVLRLLQPLKALSQVPTTAQASFASAERLFEVLDSPSEPALDKGTKTVTGLHDSLVFENVSFAYEDEPVLRDIDLTAHRGETIALVGASGAGKSTLVDLIPRFWIPTSGRILLDGTDTRDIALRSLRAQIAIVSQDTVLFNDSVRANIAYGAKGKYSQAQVEGAARAANAHGFIAQLPDGYDTLLGERGTRLSGGQRQRIAIARALLVDPPILILDEATSALDTESERLVQEAIERLLMGRTVFVIAHRLSTIVNADTILVLERGEIAERGTHSALLARGGAYARLYAMQFRDAPVTDDANAVAPGGAR